MMIKLPGLVVVAMGLVLWAFLIWGALFLLGLVRNLLPH
jgi:hypothetical protein